MARRPAVNRACGVCGETRRIHIRGRDGVPDMCQRCAPRTTACGVCGRASRIALAAFGDRPAVGRCCYKPPVATCSQCGARRRCRSRRYRSAGQPRVRPAPTGCVRSLRADVADRAPGDRQLAAGRDLLLPASARGCAEIAAVSGRATGRRPMSRSARAALPSAAPTVCVGCGQRRVAHRRVRGGILCQTCDIKHGYTTCTCHGCGQTRAADLGVCAACKLRTRLEQLAAGADADVAATLGPFLVELARSENPSSTLRWFYTPQGSTSRANCLARSRSATKGSTRPPSTRRTRSRSSARSSSQPACSSPATNRAPGSPRGTPRRCCGSHSGAIARTFAPTRPGRSRVRARAHGAAPRGSEWVVEQVRAVARDRGDQARALAR